MLIKLNRSQVSHLHQELSEKYAIKMRFAQAIIVDKFQKQLKDYVPSREKGTNESMKRKLISLGQISYNLCIMLLKSYSLL